jgi:hypothetical protein
LVQPRHIADVAIIEHKVFMKIALPLVPGPILSIALGVKPDSPG